MSRFILTGATSFIGKAIITELCRMGHEVVAVIRPNSTNLNCIANTSNISVVMCDMADMSSHMVEIQGAEYFIHLGWDGVGAEGRANWDIQEKNIQCTLKCLEVAGEIGCKAFLFGGSQAEYGYQNGMENENLICKPLTSYGKGKLQVYVEACDLAERIGIKYYHARIFSVYGIGDHPWTLVSTSITHFCNNETLKLSACKQKWNYLEVGEAANILVRLISGNADTGIYNVASEDTRVLRDFVEEIYCACGKRGTIEFGTYDPQEKIVNLNPDISKLKQVIGEWKHREFREQINEMVSCYKKYGRI